MEDQKQYFKGIVPTPIIFFVFLILGYAANRIMPVDLIFSSWTARLLVGMPIFITAGIIAITTSIVMIKNKVRRWI